MHLRQTTHTIALSLLLPFSLPAQTFHLKIIALNDLHGNLQSPGKVAPNPQSPAVPVGGVDYLAAYIAQLKQQNPNNIVVSAGDLTGASPLIASLFHDEPTIEVANRLGLNLNAVGNHEFDKGTPELLRLQHGGCSSLDANTCKGALTGTPVPFEGAHFQYLAANVFYAATGRTIFPAYTIRTWHGVKVAFIGVTLAGTPDIVVQKNIAGLRFDDEAATINALVRRLRPQGVQSFVLLIHQGGLQSAKGTLDINACMGDMQGTPIRPIVAQLDDAVDLVLSAHTHQAYICHLPNRTGRTIPVTSASAYGRMLTDVDLTLDAHSKRITAITAHNLLVDRTNPAITPDPAIRAIVERYAALAAPIVNGVVGSITANILKEPAPSGENAVSDLVADAQLDATAAPSSGAAVMTVINEDGVRTGLDFASAIPGIPDGKITFGELFGAQPFSNHLVTMTLTGEQIHTILEEQFKGCALGAPPGTTVPDNDRRIEVSEGFTYTWSRSAPPCHKVDPIRIQLNGVTLMPSATYRVTVNNLLADGGANFYAFRQGTNRLVGPPDLDATIAYLAKHPSIAPIQPHRISVIP
jgi:5'-nucleotidase